MDWYSVRCVFRDSDADRLLEERVTLWEADSFDDAIQHAEREARDHANSLNLRYLGLAQAFKLSGAPGAGAEVFSLMRESDLEDQEYLTTFFDTGTERQERCSSCTAPRADSAGPSQGRTDGFDRNQGQGAFGPRASVRRRGPA